MNQKGGLLDFSWQKNKSDLFKAYMHWEFRWFKIKQRLRVQMIDAEWVFELFELKLLGIPQPWALTHLPKGKHWVPRRSLANLKRPGKAFCYPPNAIWNGLVSKKTLRTECIQQIASLPRQIHEDILSIHSIEVFPENTNYNLDPWALSGLTHFLQNTSRRNLSFLTTKIVEACKVYEIPELSSNWVVSQQHHFGFRQYIFSKACWKGVNPFIGS